MCGCCIGLNYLLLGEPRQPKGVSDRWFYSRVRRFGWLEAGVRWPERASSGRLHRFGGRPVPWASRACLVVVAVQQLDLNVSEACSGSTNVSSDAYMQAGMADGAMTPRSTAAPCCRWRWPGHGSVLCGGAVPMAVSGVGQAVTPLRSRRVSASTRVGEFFAGVALPLALSLAAPARSLTRFSRPPLVARSSTPVRHATGHLRGNR